MAWYQLKRFCKTPRSRFTIFSFTVCFRINPASIRTFEGCNVVRFMVLEKKIYRLKILLVPTPFVMFSNLSSVNSMRAFILQEELETIEELMKCLDMSIIYLLFLVSDHTILFFEFIVTRPRPFAKDLCCFMFLNFFLDKFF